MSTFWPFWAKVLQGVIGEAPPLKNTILGRSRAHRLPSPIFFLLSKAPLFTPSAGRGGWYPILGHLGIFRPPPPAGGGGATHRQKSLYRSLLPPPMARGKTFFFDVKTRFLKGEGGTSTSCSRCVHLRPPRAIFSHLFIPFIGQAAVQGFLAMWHPLPPRGGRV